MIEFLSSPFRMQRYVGFDFVHTFFQTNLLHMLRRTSEKCGKSTNPIIICRIKAISIMQVYLVMDM